MNKIATGMARSTQERHLKSNKWITVATNYSFRRKYVSAEVWAPRVTSWRRIGVYPGFGKFRRYLSASLPFGIIQMKSRENRACTVHLGDDPEEARPEHFPQ